MPIPENFRGRSGPAKPFSHERLLAVCHAYETLYAAFIAQGGKLTSEIYAASLAIKEEIITWEQKASRLRYAAKRQRAYRAERTALKTALDEGLVYDPDRDTFTRNVDDFADTLPDLPDATKAALERYRAAKGTGPAGTAAPTSDTPPDTSNYRKSGLV